MFRAGSNYVRNIAVLDDCQLSLNAQADMIKNSIGVNCILATCELDIFKKLIESGCYIDKAVISFGMRNCKVLSVIQSFIAVHGTSKLIVIIESVDESSFKIIQCLGVRFIISRKDTINSIREVILSYAGYDYISPLFNKFIKKSIIGVACDNLISEKYPLTIREAFFFIELLNGVPPHKIASKYDVTEKLVSAYKISALKKMGFKNLNVFMLSIR